MSSLSRRSTGILLLLLATLALSACDLTRIAGPRTWTSAAELGNGGSYVVAVRDTSGRIDAAEVDPVDAPLVPDQVVNPPGQANVLLVSWTGGSCDERTDVAIDAGGPGLTISFRTTASGQVCDAMGVGHVLRLTSSQPLPAGAVKVTAVPSTGG